MQERTTTARGKRVIGGRPVSAIGLGGMPMSIEGRPDDARSIATIHAALDAGVTLIDTADSYHLLANDIGHNEQLIARALKSYPGDTSTVLVATKGTAWWNPPCGGGRATAPRLPAGRRCARRQRTASCLGVGARARPRRHTDPRRLTPAQHSGFRASDGSPAHHRRSRRALTGVVTHTEQEQDL